MKVSTTPPPSPAALTSLSAVPAPSVIGNCSRNPLAGMLFSLACSIAPRLLKSAPGTFCVATASDFTFWRTRYCAAPRAEKYGPMFTLRTFVPK